MRALWALVFCLQLAACSTAYWYDYFQSEQYDKCDKLASAEERRRCQDETRPDKDKYDRQREAARKGSSQ